MFRHAFILVAMSVIAVVFIKEINQFMHYIGQVHDSLSEKMSMIFAGDNVGHTITHVLALLLIPVVIAVVPAGAYFLFKHEPMPYTIQTVWVAWVILATILALHANKMKVALRSTTPAYAQQQAYTPATQPNENESQQT